MKNEENKETKSNQAAIVRQNATLVSAVWLIPLLAAIVGAWLLAQHLRSKGPEIKLFIENAEGIEVNTTAIRILNVDVGRVTQIRLQPNQKGVELTARLNKDVEDLMREDTQFWIVKPRIDRNGITGLGTLVSGAYIAFSPGKSSKEAYDFKVDELPPVTAIGQSGTRIYLSGKNSKMLSVGSPILYESHTVGTVESAKFNPTTQMVDYTIFIQSPNENLLNSGSEFWLEDGINISTDGAGIRINTPRLSAIFSGAISFQTPRHLNDQKPIQNGDKFVIFNNRRELESQAGERTLFYVAFFNDSVRGLAVGAPVEYRGIKIGTVADVPYFAAGDNLRLFQSGLIPVRLRLEPYLMETGGNNQREVSRESREYWQNEIQAALNRGLTATLASNNLILGSKMIELRDAVRGTAVLKPEKEYQGHIVMATQTSGGFDDLQNKVAKLLDKINNLAIDKTVNEVNGSLKELRETLKSAQNLLANTNQTMQNANKAVNQANKLMGQPATQNLPKEINASLSELRKTLQGVSPQSPMYQDVQQTLQSIDNTLKDVKPLVQTLKEKPNSLIFNSNSTDPIPKGSQ